MKRILLAMSLLVGGVATAQDLQGQINQLREELDQLRRAPEMEKPM